MYKGEKHKQGADPHSVTEWISALFAVRHTNENVYQDCTIRRDDLQPQYQDSLSLDIELILCYGSARPLQHTKENTT